MNGDKDVQPAEGLRMISEGARIATETEIVPETALARLSKIMPGPRAGSRWYALRIEVSRGHKTAFASIMKK